MPEITIALHERVEAYIKELQTKLEEAEASNASLQVLPCLCITQGTGKVITKRV